MIRCLFLADSRAHNFNKYPKLPDYSFTVDIISIRGAKIYNLVGPGVRKLHSYNTSDQIIVRLAAGVNDLTTFVYDSLHNKRVLKPSQHTADSLFSELMKFKEAIISARQNTIVLFTTIPTASLAKFQNSKKLRVQILSDNDLHIYQHELDATIDDINSQIIRHNKVMQHGVVLRTLCWHSSIRKSARRNRRGKTTHIVRNHFAHLYDGLHGDSKLKTQWHLAMYKLFATDRQALIHIRT